MAIRRGVEAVGERIGLPPVRAARGACGRRLCRQSCCRAGGKGVGGQAVSTLAGDGARGVLGVGKPELCGVGHLVVERGVEVHHHLAVARKTWPAGR